MSESMCPPRPTVLVFAGTDPTGGAGLQADVLTLAALGCHPVSVVTAVTVQDTVGVTELIALESDRVVKQARRVLDDLRLPLAAFKVGLIGSAANVAAIAAIVADRPDVPLIIDPVLASGRGDALATQDMIDSLRELLLPRASLLTPNSIEARRLAQARENEEGAQLGLDECARRLTKLGAAQVLITGTHENTAKVVNTLYDERGQVRADSWERLPGSYHGSGCTLASAIAGLHARGRDLRDAVIEAQAYTWESLRAAYRPGKGQLIPERLWAMHTTALERLASQ